VTIPSVRDLDHAIDIYVAECARRGFTPATRLKYQQMLDPFAERFKDKPPWEITPHDCRIFLDRWTNSAPGTLANLISILNTFFDFLLDEEIIEVNPMARIKRPPLKRPEELDVVSITPEDVGKLYNAAEEWDEWICLSLLSYLGPRRTAAARARRKDLDLERGTIRFREKGGKVITKPIPLELAAILRAAEENGVWATPNDYLIPNRREPRGKERSSKVVYAIVKRLAARAGLDVHPHALRAAFAVHYLDTHPGDLDALQKLMGHTRTETTQVYLRRQDKFKAMERVRDLSWGASAFPPSADMPPTGFEPVHRP
jgi:integrase/recombinase XerD